MQMLTFGFVIYRAGLLLLLLNRRVMNQVVRGVDLDGCYSKKFLWITENEI